MTDPAEELAEAVDDSDWVDAAVRFGLVVHGAVYLLLGVLAARLAFGDYRGSVSKGAFKQLAESPFGTALLVLVALGMGLLVVWKALDAAVGHREKSGVTRLRMRGADAFKGIVYAWVAYKAVKTALGSKGGGSRANTADLMELPLGTWIVGLIGLSIVLYGAAHVWQAVTGRLRENLTAEGRSGGSGTAYLLVGTIGYLAKGLAFSMIGALFVYAAVTERPRRSGGLDGALHRILERPFGSWLLLAMALGLACYGVFSIIRARHLRR